MLQQCHWGNWDDITLHLFYYLFHMQNGIAYTKVEIQSTVPQFIDQFLMNSPKISSQLFFTNFVNGSRGAGCFIL